MALVTTATVAEENVIDTGAVRLTELAEGIYAVSPNFAGANGALILSRSGNIVVDTHGSPASARALIDAVREISDTPIRYVINTHWHVDHHAGNVAYRNAFGNDVIFISHDETRKEIPTLGAEQFADAKSYRTMPIQAADQALASNAGDHGEKLSADQIQAIREFRDGQSDYADQQDYDYVLADLTYSESITLHGDPIVVDVFYLHPAHTTSDTVVYIRNEEILVVGDLLTQPILWSWSSYPAGYVKTLKALENLPVKKIVIGHGGPVLDGKDYLVQARQFLEAVVAYATKAREGGIGSDEAVEAAAENAVIESFRRRFVAEEQDGMFDQMVGWTVSRAYLAL
jgi:glyoxylase-like metal-dependent hydrolase (beta-lactamase superfamily II)